MNGVVGPFSVYTEDELRQLFSDADDVALIRHYLEKEVRPLLDIVLSRACRDVLPPERYRREKRWMRSSAGSRAH